MDTSYFNFTMRPYGRCGFRRSNSIVPSLFDSLENHLDQRVGNIFRTLPAVLMEFQSPSVRQGGDHGANTSSEPRSRAVVSTKDNQFRIQLDIVDFSPKDMTVKVVGDKVLVSAKRESKTSGCYEYQEMHREFSLPESVDPNTVVSKFRNKGELIIEAPMMDIKEISAGRNVPIQFENKEDGDKSEAEEEEYVPFVPFPGSIC